MSTDRKISQLPPADSVKLTDYTVLVDGDTSENKRGTIQQMLANVAGTGTVTSVNATGADGIVVAGGPITTNGALALSLGNITPDSVTATGAIVGNNLSGTNTGDQAISLVGDVEASAGTSTLTTSISTGAVTNAKLANMEGPSIKGRTSAGNGAVSDLSVSQVTSILPEFVGDSGSGGQKGLVTQPAPGDGVAHKFLRADGTWSIPSSEDILPSQSGQAGKVLSTTGSTPQWVILSGVGTVTSVDVVGTSDISSSGGPITTDGTINIALTNTGVSPGTYGSTSSTPAITVDAKGRITAAIGPNIQIAQSQVTSLVTDLAAKIPTIDKGTAGGVASLDGSGKVPTTQLPDSVLGQLSYQGTWDASTNNPTLANPPASTTKGYYYIASAAGTFSSLSFEIGDWIVSSGTAWQKVDNTDAVASVFGRNGNIVASNGDYTASQVTNVPAGNVSAITVQAAINELDSEKLSNANNLSDVVSPSTARTNLGVAIGTNVQAYSVQLDSVAALASNGLVARTAANTVTARTLTGTANEVTVTNGDGVSGNPTLSLPSALTLTGKTVTGGTFASPALTTPALGTPASGTLTNCTSLPVSTGISGLGTGVATALAVNVGSAGAPVLNGGSLGTPSSGTVTNLTGTASININGTVGATTPSTGSFTSLSATGATNLDAGTVSAPGLYLEGETSTGLYRIGANNHGYAVSGAKVLDIASTGLAVTGTIGINATSTAPLHVYNSAAGAANVEIARLACNYSNTAGHSWALNWATSGGTLINRIAAESQNSGNNVDMVFSTYSSNTLAERMRIAGTGNVGIGATSPVVISGRTTLTVGNGTTSSANIGVLYLRSGNGGGGSRDFSIEGDASGSLLFVDRGYNGGNNGSGTRMFLDYSANLYVYGNVTAYYSDSRLKQEEGPITNALDKVKALRGFFYHANETAQSLGYKSEREVGVSAQEVEAVLPELIKPAPIDPQYKTLDYARLVPLLIEAIKELSAEVERLKA